MIHISNELSLFYDNYTAKSPFTLLSTSAVLLGLCVLFHIKSDVCFFVRLQVSRRLWHRSAWNFEWWYTSVSERSSPLLGAVSPRDSKFWA